ncbi:hypothetical protein Tco_0867603 [Tanacetum coccineum]
MINKIDTVLKAITDRIAGTLPSDMVKKPKLGTHPVLSARSYPIIDPQCSSHPSNSYNDIKPHLNDATIPQTSLRQPEIETKTPQLEEPEPTIEDEFQDLHLYLPVLEVLAHALIYNAILDKYVESLELGKNGSAFVQGETPAKIGDPGINELDEMRLDAYESSISYKERTKRWHDKRIKTPINYEKGDKVLLFNSRLRLFPGKLNSRWYGLFSVGKDMKNRAIELYDKERSEFIMNKQRVKPYQNDLLNTNKDDDVTLDDEGEVT